MTTIKEICIDRNYAVRPMGNVDFAYHIWYVEKGEAYDLISFKINELKKSYYWRDCLCIPCGMSEEKIAKFVKRYAKTKINNEDIESYRRFLKEGEIYGWD